MKRTRSTIALTKIVKQLKAQGYRPHAPQVTYTNNRTVTVSQAFTK